MRAAPASPVGSALVKAMEVAVVFSPGDYAGYLERGRSAAPSDGASGFEYSGSFAGRNIEKIYELAEAAGLPCSLEPAVRACFERPSERPGHVLICSGFYVLHDRAQARPGLALGSAETDGPLGALAALRAFAARGVPVSLVCDAHTGPVLRAGYEAMLDFLGDEDPEGAATIREHSRCLPPLWDRRPPPPGAGFGAAKPGVASGTTGAGDAARLDPQAIRAHAAAFPGRPLPAPGSLRGRSLRVAANLRAAIREAWGDEHPGPVDCLFSLERLGAPYCNIRGMDIAEHTEPLDCLWATSPADAPGLDPEAVARMVSYLGEHDIQPGDFQGFRDLADVDRDALTVSVGDGGNEVGLGRVALLDGVAALRPGGDDSFVPLRENGCYRSADHVVLGTVSNWAGSAFEMAAHLLLGPPAKDYLARLRGSGRSLGDLEVAVLDAIAEFPASAVDGVYPEKERSVDGMPFEPHHRSLYDRLWELVGTAAAP